jgi:hypothetical protein
MIDFCLGQKSGIQHFKRMTGNTNPVDVNHKAEKITLGKSAINAIASLLLMIAVIIPVKHNQQFCSIKLI